MNADVIEMIQKVEALVNKLVEKRVREVLRNTKVNDLHKLLEENKNDNDSVILEVIKTNKRTAISFIVQKTGLSREAVRYSLRKLCSQKKIVQKGNRRTAHYVVA